MSEITHLFLKDNSRLQSRHDVLEQAASCCIEGKFSAGHHIAIHQLESKTEKKNINHPVKLPFFGLKTVSNQSIHSHRVHEVIIFEEDLEQVPQHTFRICSP